MGPPNGSLGGEVDVAHRLFVLNGPNLDMLGRREPDVYGPTTLADIERRCRVLARELDFDLFFAQSNSEAQLIEWLHQAHDERAAVIINPAGLTTTSVSIMDALRMLSRPVIEVHISNIYRREPVYHGSLVSRTAWGLIAGLGTGGYELAMRGLAARLAERP
jgi:3-dehydroquinate dehydratase II